MTGYLELAFDLGALDATAAEEACFASGAASVTFVDAQDDPVLEPKPGRGPPVAANPRALPARAGDRGARCHAWPRHCPGDRACGNPVHSDCRPRVGTRMAEGLPRHALRATAVGPTRTTRRSRRPVRSLWTWTPDLPSAPARTQAPRCAWTWLDAHLAPRLTRHRLRLRLGRARAGRRQARRRRGACLRHRSAGAAGDRRQCASQTRVEAASYMCTAAQATAAATATCCWPTSSPVRCANSGPRFAPSCARAARSCWRASWSPGAEVTAAYAPWFDVARVRRHATAGSACRAPPRG